MVVTDYNEQFLDKRGTDHLIDELKAYIDGIVNGNIDLSNYVTKEELQAKLDALNINIDLSAYATKEELTQAINSIDLSAYATTQYVDNAIANVPSGGNVDLSNYYTKAETYNKTEVDTAIENAIYGSYTFDPNFDFSGKTLYFDTTKNLAQKNNSVGIIFKPMKKEELFKTVILDGALPRKTFSMGHSYDKRYYLESRKIK